MGLIKFTLPSTAWSEEDLRQASILGQDRTPTPAQVEIRSGELLVRRPVNESGRLIIPWRVDGFGRLILSTATLAERFEPYDLCVELARGTINDIQNQLADWQHQGLVISGELRRLLSTARHHFARAATSGDQPAQAQSEAERALRSGLQAGRLLTESYASQVIERRREQSPRLPTWLGVDLGAASKPLPWWSAVPDAFNAARIGVSWRSIAVDAGNFRWDVPDTQISWCRKRHLLPVAGPLIDLRAPALPDWLWLWQGDFEEILNQATDFVRQAITRYRGKMAAWHLVARPAAQDVLGLSEEEQVRLTARLIQVARSADPNVPLVVDFDRPWGDWLATSTFQLGPLHLADSLARADLGLSGIGLEVVPGFMPNGSPLRELFEFSRLLDLYALIGLPLHIMLAFPSQVIGPTTENFARLDLRQWPQRPNEESQRDWASRWVSLAIAKPFVQSVEWLEPSDGEPRLYPGCGLFRADHSRKPAFDWMSSIRKQLLT